MKPNMRCFSCPHVLKLVISSRQAIAQVVNSSNNLIVAAASSMEEEFRSKHRAKLQQLPRCQYLWDVRTAVRIGENLATRLKAKEIANVHIDLQGELSRPRQYKKRVLALIDSVKKNGIELCGTDTQLEKQENVVAGGV